MKNRSFIGGLLSVSLLLQALPASAYAKTSAAEKKRLEDRLESLENELKQVKEQVRSADAENEKVQEEKKKQAVVTANSEGFSISSQDKAFQLKIRGYIQADTRLYLDDEGDKFNNTFLLRRVRPIFEGTLTKYLDFRIMPDFGEGKTVLQDAYINAKPYKELQFRVGKFKEPVGIERLQSATAITFIERGLPTNLVPNRDLGIMVHGDTFGGILQYAAGIFNGVADGGSGDGDGDDEKDFAGRVFVQPFKRLEGNPAENLGIGVAGTWGVQHGSSSAPLLPSYKSPGQQTFFTYRPDAIADGDHYRISPQLYYSWGPVGFLSEYVLSSQEVSLSNVNQQFTNHAWQVLASYVISGGKAAYTGVVPNNPINPKKGHWGAFELAARYGELYVDKEAFPFYADPTKSAHKAQSWGLAFNWYLSRNLRFALNYDQTNYQGGAENGNRPTEHALFNRVQLSF